MAIAARYIGGFYFKSFWACGLLVDDDGVEEYGLAVVRFEFIGGV